MQLEISTLIANVVATNCRALEGLLTCVNPQMIEEIMPSLEYFFSIGNCLLHKKTRSFFFACVYLKTLFMKSFLSKEHADAPQIILNRYPLQNG